jgi:hypothetical protein
LPLGAAFLAQRSGADEQRPTEIGGAFRLDYWRRVPARGVFGA